MVDTAVEVVALGDTLEYSMRVEKVKAPADTARLWEGPKRRTTSDANVVEREIVLVVVTATSSVCTIQTSSIRSQDSFPT